MKIRPLEIEGAFEITPVLRGDARGTFLEWYRLDRLAADVGHPFRLAQANMSVSAAGVVRGIHFADVPPGQAKYVTCTRGAFLDVVVDIRVGSPTFGRWEAVRLDDVDRRAVYLSEGLGHGVCALSDDSTCSTCVRRRTARPGSTSSIRSIRSSASSGQWLRRLSRSATPKHRLWLWRRSEGFFPTIAFVVTSRRHFVPDDRLDG